MCHLVISKIQDTISTASYSSRFLRIIDKFVYFDSHLNYADLIWEVLGYHILLGTACNIYDNNIIYYLIKYIIRVSLSDKISSVHKINLLHTSQQPLCLKNNLN